MTLPVPINRTELYLAKIAGEDVTIPDMPINNTEVFLARLAGADIVLPTPINTLQVWLAILCGEQYSTPPVQGAELIGVQMVRTEFLAASAGLDGVTTPTPENRAEEYWAKIAEEMAVQTITVKGTSLHLLHVVSGIDDLQYIYGDTEQTKYSGKNILCLNNDNIVLNNGSSGKVTLDFVDNVASLTTISNLAGASFAYYYTQELDSTKTYVFSVLIKKIAGTTTNRVSFSYSDDGTTWSANSLQDFTISVGGEQSYSKVFSGHSYYRFGLYACTNSGTVVGDKTDYTNLQLELGSTATSYEPYVGGTASPNPDYPQDVHVVTGEQTVTVTGKNLFNTNNPEGASSTSAVTGTNSILLEKPSTRTATYLFRPRLVAGTYTISYNVSKGATNTEGCRSNVSQMSGSGTTIIANSTKFDGAVSYTFTATSEVDRLYFYIPGSQPDGATAAVTNIQIESGSTATPFQPYQVPQSYTVDLGSTELCKIGDYQDYIYKNGDDWYVHKEIGENIYIGDQSELWVKVGTDAKRTAYRTGLDNAKRYAGNVTPVFVSNRFLPVSANATWVAGVMSSESTLTAGNLVLCLNPSSFTTVDDLTTWLATNNVTFYYALATATDTKITDATLVSQLNALDSATLPTPEAFVTVSGNLPAPIQFTYQGKL